LLNLLAKSILTKPGVLVECDPSVKAIILKYDEERHDYIVEDLDDDRHLVIKENQLQHLKERLGQVCLIFPLGGGFFFRSDAD
jgi:TFIIH basal transcription factor complex TTD-A subunit